MSGSKKVLFILMPKDYQPIEFKTPYEMLREAGHEVTIAGLEHGAAVASDGTKQQIDWVLEDFTEEKFDEYDALVIPGGPGSSIYLWGNSNVQEVAQYFHNNDKLIATICHACAVPAEAGILKGRTATIYPDDEAKKLFDRCDVLFSDKPCVVDNGAKVITAQSPNEAMEFGQAILNFLVR